MCSVCPYISCWSVQFITMCVVSCVLQLLDSVGSVDTVRSVLKHILDLVAFSVPFPKLSKTLLKVVINHCCIFSYFWSKYICSAVHAFWLWFHKFMICWYSANSDEIIIVTHWQLFDIYEWLISWCQWSLEHSVLPHRWPVSRVLSVGVLCCVEISRSVVRKFWWKESNRCILCYSSPSVPVAWILASTWLQGQFDASYWFACDVWLMCDLITNLCAALQVSM